MPKAFRKAFRHVVQTLAQADIRLKVWRHKGRFAQKKLLYAPDYAVPWPHWSDVDRRFWSEHVLEMFRYRKCLEDMPTREHYEYQFGLAYDSFPEKLADSDTE
jgi:hypothetical protein